MEKAEAITLDEARELVGDAVLWPRMRDFLWDFAPSIHVSWLEEKFGSLEVWKFGYWLFSHFQTSNQNFQLIQL